MPDIRKEQDADICNREWFWFEVSPCGTNDNHETGDVVQQIPPFGWNDGPQDGNGRRVGGCAAQLSFLFFSLMMTVISTEGRNLKQ